MLTHYIAIFILPGETEQLTRTVLIDHEYSTFADIPRILSVAYYSTPDRSTEIHFISVNKA